MYAESDRRQIEALIPHRGRMCLLERIVEVNAEAAACRAVVGTTWPFATDRGVGSMVCVELVAQAAGVTNGWINRQKNGEGFDRSGWLVGVKSSVFHVAYLPLGAPLDIRAENRFSYENYREVSGSVRMGDTRVAEVSLQLFQGDAAPAERPETK